MANFSAQSALTATLSGTATVDNLALTRVFSKVELVHHGNVDEAAYYRLDGVAPVAAADENRVLLPNERLTVFPGGNGAVSIDIVVATGAPTVTLEGTA